MSDCVNDDTVERVPWCLEPPRLECEALEFPECRDAAQCQWCQQWGTFDGKSSCQYSPFSTEPEMDNAALCQFNFTGSGELYYTGFGQFTCPLPAGQSATHVQQQSASVAVSWPLALSLSRHISALRLCACAPRQTPLP